MIHSLPQAGPGACPVGCPASRNSIWLTSTEGMLEGGWIGRFLFISVRTPSSGPGVRDALMQCLE